MNKYFRKAVFQLVDNAGKEELVELLLAAARKDPQQFDELMEAANQYQVWNSIRPLRLKDFASPGQFMDYVKKEQPYLCISYKEGASFPAVSGLRVTNGRQIQGLSDPFGLADCLAKIPMWCLASPAGSDSLGALLDLLNAAVPLLTPAGSVDQYLSVDQIGELVHLPHLKQWIQVVQSYILFRYSPRRFDQYVQVPANFPNSLFSRIADNPYLRKRIGSSSFQKYLQRLYRIMAQNRKRAYSLLTGTANLVDRATAQAILAENPVLIYQNSAALLRAAGMQKPHS